MAFLPPSGPWNRGTPPGGQPRASTPAGSGVVVAVVVTALLAAGGAALWRFGGTAPSQAAAPLEPTLVRLDLPAVPGGVPGTGTTGSGAAMPAWEVCFTPGGDCTGVVVHELAAARRQVLVQAYAFTSAPIMRALTEAHARGVEVRVILDHSQLGERYSAATFLLNAGIRALVDDPPGIAHSKVMVIDGGTVITGSFNFTRAAQERNAENLLVLRDPAIAALYTANWGRRAAVSPPYDPAVQGSPAGAGTPDTPKNRPRHNLF